VNTSTGRQEVVMSPTVISIEAPSLVELDLAISVAYVALSGARQRFDRCPSGENQQRIDEALAEVDRLLDARLTAAH
jgi:hypothetical protein